MSDVGPPSLSEGCPYCAVDPPDEPRQLTAVKLAALEQMYCYCMVRADSHWRLHPHKASHRGCEQFRLAPTEMVLAARRLSFP